MADKRGDLKTDPSPDIVVEVDLTHTDIDKNRLYSGLEGAEFWWFDGDVWRIHCLMGDAYEEAETSPTFSFVQKQDLSFFEKAQ
ncbi:hypothetical protein SPB21_26700 [Leptothoe sp. ISB3NOV94-8A]